MLRFLQLMINELFNSIVDNANDNGERMLSVLTIMFCFHEMIPKYARMDRIPADFISELLSMLCLKPDNDAEKCEDYEYLKKNNIPRSKAYMVILDFVMHLIKVRCWKAPEWLYSIPLLHFLSNVSKPFQTFSLNPQKIVFKSDIFKLEEFKSETNSKNFR